MDNSKEKRIKVLISKCKINVDEKANVCIEIPSEYGFVNEANAVVEGENEYYNIKFNYLFTRNNINFFTCNIQLKDAGLYNMSLRVIVNEKEKWVSNINNEYVLSEKEEDKCVYDFVAFYNDFKVPDWAKGKVMYHIFVDRFYKSNNYEAPFISDRKIKEWGKLPDWKEHTDIRKNNKDFFMGNLEGIVEKIDYLKTLGVEILYLSPIFESQSNHRYDVADYENVDPFLGNNQHLKKLCVKAHRNGMKVVVDAVFNHTGNDSKYFNQYGRYETVGAYQSERSPYFNWYKRDENGNFTYWWGFKNLPVCNGFDPSWQKFIYEKNGVIDKWFKFGIDGIRLDVADELTDDFINNIRKAVKRNKKDAFIIGEVWENAVTKKKDGYRRKYLLGNGMDTVMNYPFTNAILKYVRFGDYETFLKTINDILCKYNKESIDSLMNSLSTHDITRALTTLVGEGITNTNELVWDVNYEREWQLKNCKLSKEKYYLGRNMLKAATVIQYFLPGNSCIYYGDEIGMYGYRDPFNRKCYEWDNIDTELLQFYRDIGKIKKNNTLLKDAQLCIEYIDENLLVMKRVKDNDYIRIVVNRTENNIETHKAEVTEKEHIIYKYNIEKQKIGAYGFTIIGNKKIKNI